MNLVAPFQRAMGRLDLWQRRYRWLGVPYGVVRKFGDDNANLYVVALGWYGFTAIYPLLLVVVTVLRIHRGGITRHGHCAHAAPVSRHWQPVQPGVLADELHGSTLGLVIGVVGLLYGAQGVTQTAQQAMATVWNVPDT